MISVVFMAHFTWAQIAINFATSFFMIFYFCYVWPFESHQMTKLEIFNEVTAIQLCYFMMCFTDWVPSTQTRYALGWIFIVIISLHLGVHMTILLYNTYTILKRKAKEKYYRRKSHRPQKQDPKRTLVSTKIMRKKNLRQNGTPLTLIAEDSNSEKEEGPSLTSLIGRGVKRRIHKNIEL